MPSPVGHALGGLAAAFVVDSLVRRPVLTLPLLAASAVMAVAPDLDILAGSHRTYSHSIGGVSIVGLVLWVILRTRSAHPAAAAAAVTAAYGSHVPLDWLSKDTSYPSGLTALWPLTMHYYKSGLDVFDEISRRYWLPGEFIVGNLRAASWELVLVGPCLLFAWVYWSKKTLKTKTEEGTANTARTSR